MTATREKWPNTLPEVDEQLRRVLAERLPAAKIRNVSAMTPDASLRRYYRVALEAAVPPLLKNSAVAMIFDAVASPEATGFSIDSDRAYVELAAHLAKHQVAVPALYLDARELSLLLIEDLGDQALIDVARRGSITETTQTFRLAIDQLAKLQAIAPSTECFAFQRSFRAPTYVREMEEFRDFILVPKDPPEEAISIAEELFTFLGPTLEGFPQVLAHRDFHAWNLLVSERGEIRVIDFQDALLATAPYDLVSLLNDRDMDSVLGASAYRELVLYGANRLVGAGAEAKSRFLYEYDRVLLQRDLKTTGRFAKLATVRGLSQYAAWIPGNLRRIGRTLERICALGAEAPVYQRFLTSLLRVFPEVGEGASARERFQ